MAELIKGPKFHSSGTMHPEREICIKEKNISMKLTLHCNKRSQRVCPCFIIETKQNFREKANWSDSLLGFYNFEIMN